MTSGDHHTQSAQRPPFCKGSDFAGHDPPPRTWVVPDLIPSRTVTLLGGDGGTGKSLIALQLAVAVASGAPWLGLSAVDGPALFMSAEDDVDELHRRLHAICTADGIGMSTLDDLTVRSLAGHDALLVVEYERSLHPAETLRELRDVLGRERPALVCLDTLADLYPSNENDRAKVRQFTSILRGLALEFDCAIVLLAHPSLTGLNSGSGLSGSTAWNNSVRSRLYLERVAEDGVELDHDLRRLTNKKSNHGRLGIELILRYSGGVFVAETDQGGLDRAASQAKADRVFLKLLDEFTVQGRKVNHAGGSTYAPKVFAEHPGSERMTKRTLAAAMNRLLAAEHIRVEVEGPPSKKRSFLVANPD
ncbi:MAG: AAA family ATPase [Pseudomonadota bacterium]